MGKAPADQFYWGDYLNDVELQAACSASRGIWTNALCRMWFSKTKGELTNTPEKLIGLLNCTDQEFTKFLAEAETLLFCYVSRNGNGTVTLRNRRMYRDQKAKELNRLRQERFRGKRGNNSKNNAPITPLSSSSSSINTKIPKKEHFILPTKEEVNESAIPKIKEDLNKICEHLYETKKFLKVHAFKNKMLKEGKNERAILHTLVRCSLKDKFEDSPWGFCIKIIQVEDGNYNEYEYGKDKN